MQDESIYTTGALFDPDLPSAKWTTFIAHGYSNPVTGIIYRGDHQPVTGMPVGVLDTGFIDISPDGTFGNSTIFNDMTPRGGPLNTPFLGLSVAGKSWVLADPRSGVFVECNTDTLMTTEHENVVFASMIDYWGHYPVVDMQFRTEAPIDVAIRTWAPFVPGDVKAMNTPGMAFEIHLKNITTTEQAGTLAFSFPGFLHHQTKNRSIGYPHLACDPKLPEPCITREHIGGENSGVVVYDENRNVSYCLLAIGEKSPRIGADLGNDINKWASIDVSLPPTTGDGEGGSSVAVDFALKPGEKRIIQFVLSWYAPVWDANGTPGAGDVEPFAPFAAHQNSFTARNKSFRHMYTTIYNNATDAANYLVNNYDSLLHRILAWQEVIYTASDIPHWLGDALINNLMYLPRCSAWSQAIHPVGAWCRLEDGIFGMNEAPQNCPQMSCLACDAISGMLPLIYFAPMCALSSLRAWKAYQEPNGDFPFTWGLYYDMTTPQSVGYQRVMNGASYMILIDRYWQVTEDDGFLREFYESAKRASLFSFNTRPKYGLSQIVAMPEPTDEDKQDMLEWFEDRNYYGYVAHPGGLRMAHAEMMRRWANTMGDTDFVKKLDAWLESGTNALEQYLWNGRFYDAYNEPESGKRDNAFFTAQINGQYYAKSTGVPGVFPKDHIDSVLRMIRTACSVTKTGMPPVLVNNDGTLFQERSGNDAEGAGYLTGLCGYTNPQVTKIAMTFMYEGQQEFGLDLLHKNLELNFLKWGYTWDGALACSQKSDDGERSYGTDYYQNMILWGAPAALAGEDISAPIKPGGLVDRILTAARRTEECE